jgi:hypothetical protein
MDQRKPGQKRGGLIFIFLVILVLASFSFTIAFSAKADSGNRLLQNPKYRSVPLVKQFRNAYSLGVLGVRK